MLKLGTTTNQGEIVGITYTGGERYYFTDQGGTKGLFLESSFTEVGTTGDGV